MPEIEFSPGIRSLTKKSTFPSLANLSIANTSSTTTFSNKIWSKFMDEYECFDLDLEDNERPMWLATTNVKIKLERCIRNLKTELNTIPSCAGRLESGQLVHPRV